MFRVTNLKGNRRYIIPGPVKNGSFEFEWRCVEVDCIKAAQKVKTSLDREFHGRKFFNISRDEEKGLQQLIDRRSDENLVFFQTDKSGRMTVDNVDNFSSKMETHLKCGKEVSMEIVENIEKEMNSRSKTWARILEMGSAWGHGDRVKEAVCSASGQPPPIYGLPKDHKKVKEGEDHPLRPVCGASSGPGSRISNLLTMIIKPCND